MLSDTDAACVVIACVFRKEKRIAAGPMNVTKLNRPDPRNRRLTTYYIQVEWQSKEGRNMMGPTARVLVISKNGNTLIITIWL